ncbi:hypothetical protein O6H91_06G059700 [Diphasiastrum complanatum]|uniref:Uncharacterized protein n=1 Tax=Diphasiastrum complanatum TaxID=34168 RepID=A0ACC2DE40_DIPCM|nr:hypothetical protein O6H91_06G059700 [Diphasiastrum complanatum]
MWPRPRLSLSLSIERDGCGGGKPEAVDLMLVVPRSLLDPRFFLSFLRLLDAVAEKMLMDRILQAVKKCQRLASCEGPLSSFGTTFSLRRSRSLQSFKQRKIYKRSANSVPSDVRAGYLAVYVGPERRRFIIKTHYLSHPLFKILLEKVEEEYGFDHIGGIQIPCEVTLFEHILWLLGKNDPDF